MTKTRVRKFSFDYVPVKKKLFNNVKHGGNFILERERERVLKILIDSSSERILTFYKATR